MRHPVQLLKWDHARFNTLLNYLQGLTADPETACDADELLELYALLKPGIRGRHHAQERAIWRQMLERGILPASRLRQLERIQSRLAEEDQRLESRIRAAIRGAVLSGTELGIWAQPFINRFRELIEFEEQQIFPLLERPSPGHHARSTTRHGIDLNYRVRPQE